MGSVAKPNEEQANMYVMATILACFDAHVSALPKVGKGKLYQRLANTLTKLTAVRTANDTKAAKQRGRGYSEENKAM
jgi:hypothetical protein